MPLAHNLQRLSGFIIDFVFPRRCVGCSKTGTLLCPNCRQRLPRLEPPLCALCSRPIPAGDRCPACRQAPLAVDGVRCAYALDGLARDMVHGLKYRGWRALAPPMGELMAEAVALNWVADVLVPVPLHRRRLRERGFNQAELLARAIGVWLNLPVAADALVRVRHTPSQARSATAAERRRNVRDAFAALDQVFRGRRVLVIDDVCTTGATLEACATALRLAGAGAVFGLAFAREL